MKVNLDIDIEFLKNNVSLTRTDNIAKYIIDNIDFSKCITVKYEKTKMTIPFNEVDFEKAYTSISNNLNKDGSYTGAFKEIPTDYNVYFIIDAIENIIYYVGKKSGNDIRSRLKEHLCKKSGTTKSRILDVHGIVSKMEEPSIRVYALKVEPSGLYSAVEGLLIDYLTKDYEHEKYVWNERLD